MENNKKLEVLAFSDEIARNNGFIKYSVGFIVAFLIVSIVVMVIAAVVLGVCYGDVAMIVGILGMLVLLPIVIAYFRFVALERCRIYWFEGSRVYTMRLPREFIFESKNGERTDDFKSFSAYVKMLLSRINENPDCHKSVVEGVSKIQIFDDVELIKKTPKYTLYEGTDSQERIKQFKIRHIYRSFVIEQNNSCNGTAPRYDDIMNSVIPGRQNDEPKSMNKCWIVTGIAVICFVVFLLTGYMILGEYAAGLSLVGIMWGVIRRKKIPLEERTAQETVQLVVSTITLIVSMILVIYVILLNNNMFNM